MDFCFPFSSKVEWSCLLQNRDQIRLNLRALRDNRIIENRFPSAPLNLSPVAKFLLAVGFTGLRENHER